MPRKDRRHGNPPLAVIAARRVGLRFAHQAVGYMVYFATTAEALGRPEVLTADDVAEWWGMSRSWAFKQQAVYRKAFPEWPNPLALYDDLEGDQGELVRKRLRRLASKLLELDAIRDPRPGVRPDEGRIADDDVDEVIAYVMAAT